MLRSYLEVLCSAELHQDGSLKVFSEIRDHGDPVDPAAGPANVQEVMPVHAG